jgi:hypothetical protein
MGHERSGLGYHEAEVHLGSPLLHVGKLRFSFERFCQHSKFR